MTKRFAHIRELVFLRDVLRKYPNQTDRLMKESIILALPPAYRKLYDWIGACYHPVNTAMVMKAWDWKANMASTALNELWQFGLLKRTEYTDNLGKGFKYEQTP